MFYYNHNYSAELGPGWHAALRETMDPVELSSTKTPLQMYDSLCIRLKNLVSRLKVLIVTNEIEKCRQQLLRIKEVYSDLFP